MNLSVELLFKDTRLDRDGGKPTTKHTHDFCVDLFSLYGRDGPGF